MMPPNVLGLPHEILHCILAEVNPQDLARVCRCCHTFNKYIKHNRLLYRELYLKNFDEPPTVPGEDIVWETELPKLVKFQKILQSSNVEEKRSQLDIVLSSIDHLLATAATGAKRSLNLQCLSELFEDASNVQGLMCNSLLFEMAKAETLGRRPKRTRAPSDSERRVVAVGQNYGLPVPDGSNGSPGLTFDPDESTKRTRQLSAKLHVLYGVPIEYARDVTGHGPRYDLRSELKARSTHPYARSLVYDLRRYTDATLFGPFMDDHSQDVDWEKLEAIMVILSYNMTKYLEPLDTDDPMIPSWDTPFEGAVPRSFVSPPVPLDKQPEVPLAARDPYNITGTWMRIVCFLDYNDLFGFNFLSEDAIPMDQPRHALDTQEAFRLIIMKLEVTKIVPPGEDEGQALPVVWFKGSSAAVRPPWDPNAVSKIRGMVRLTPQGHVRWTSWSIFHGEERYRSEGVQIGGPQSARGVLGTWFDKDYDVHGPAGPTCFWKVTDELKDISAKDDAH